MSVSSSSIIFRPMAHHLYKVQPSRSNNEIDRRPQNCRNSLSPKCSLKKIPLSSQGIRPLKNPWLRKALIGNDSDTDESRISMHNFAFVSWFREAMPYIQGHRGSVLVLVFPAEVLLDGEVLNCMLQDVALLHGLGVKVVLVPGTHLEIDRLLNKKEIAPKFLGAYRVTDAEGLEAAMEASGKIRVQIEARLSQSPSIPALRRHGDSKKWHEVGISVASGNFVFAKRRGVVDGVDFGYTGEVKRVDVERIRDRLDRDCVVLLSNLGFSPSGEVLNCNTYEVATACAIALKADKLICMLDGGIKDKQGHTVRWMTLTQADQLIRQKANCSSTAGDYVRAVTGNDFATALGVHSSLGESETDLCEAEFDLSELEEARAPMAPAMANGNRIVNASDENRGFPISGSERSGKFGFLSELAAAVYACRAGIRRVHLLDSSINGSLLLELYSREGVGTMISSDLYEGTRPAETQDFAGIGALLEPLEQAGILAPRNNERLMRDLPYFTVVEQDGVLIACAALIPFPESASAEVAAFAVAPQARGRGRGDSLLGYLEKRALELGVEKLFLLTTRTADWFIQRGFKECDEAQLPERRVAMINKKRNSKVFMKQVQDLELLQFYPEENAGVS